MDPAHACAVPERAVEGSLPGPILDRLAALVDETVGDDERAAYLDKV